MAKVTSGKGSTLTVDALITLVRIPGTTLASSTSPGRRGAAFYDVKVGGTDRVEKVMGYTFSRARAKLALEGEEFVTNRSTTPWSYSLRIKAPNLRYRPESNQDVWFRPEPCSKCGGQMAETMDKNDRPVQWCTSEACFPMAEDS